MRKHDRLCRPPILIGNLRAVFGRNCRHWMFSLVEFETMLRPLAVYFCGLLVSEVSAAPISFPAASCPFYVSGPTSFCDEADIRRIRCSKRQHDPHRTLHY